MTVHIGKIDMGTIPASVFGSLSPECIRGDAVVASTTPASRAQPRIWAVPFRCDRRRAAEIAAGQLKRVRTSNQDRQIAYRRSVPPPVAARKVMRWSAGLQNVNRL